MCFDVDSSAPRPTQRVAWKIMTLSQSEHGDYLRSPVFACCKQWAPGDIMVRSAGDRIVTRTSYDWKLDKYVLVDEAHHGIYVYSHRAAALHECAFSSQVVVKVLVDPDDWICSSYLIPSYGVAENTVYKNARYSTYERVRIAPIEQQPFIEYA